MLRSSGPIQANRCDHGNSSSESSPLLTRRAIQLNLIADSPTLRSQDRHGFTAASRTCCLGAWVVAEGASGHQLRLEAWVRRATFTRFRSTDVQNAREQQNVTRGNVRCRRETTSSRAFKKPGRCFTGAATNPAFQKWLVHGGNKQCRIDSNRPSQGL